MITASMLRQLPNALAILRAATSVKRACKRLEIVRRGAMADPINQTEGEKRMLADGAQRVQNELDRMLRLIQSGKSR